MTVLEALDNKGDLTYSKLKKLTKLSDNELRKELNNLIKEKKVILDDYHYFLIEQGTIEAKNNIYGFIIPDNEEKPDVYLKLNGRYRDGDVVSFYRYRDFDFEGRPKDYASVIKLLERTKKIVVGKIVKEYGELYLVERNTLEKHRIFKRYSNGALPNMICKAEYVDGKNDLKITEVIGNVDDPGVEIAAIAASYGFITEFNDDVKSELKSIPSELSNEELTKRKIYDDRLIFTIDGNDSKDFDDAVSCVKLSDDLYELGVYIADVSNYVKFNSALDDEAYKRSTSVYLANKVIPMLPHELSNGICSLNEGVYRNVLACIMTIDSNGRTRDYKIEEGIIKSRHRMTYDDVNLILEGNQSLIDKYNDIYESIMLMNELHLILRERSNRKGALEFEVDEYKFALNEDGSPKSIILRDRKEAEKIIEDFMIKANEVVATHMTNAKLPCLYRVHESPDQDKLKQVLKLINNMGIDMQIPRNDIKPKIIQNTLLKIDNSPKKHILNNLLLRSMMKAKYQPDNLGHYGLALENYAHFTSPIRRYPDLILHRIIKELIIHPDKYLECYNYYQRNLVEIGLKTSAGERRSIECEREVNDMLTAWYMESKVNGIFSGMITSITSFGMFVTVDSGIEGLVHIRNMNSDYFVYDEDNMRLVSSSKIYNLGDIVDVVCIGADRNTSKVDFMLKEDYIRIQRVYESSSNE